jgi:methylated-DNA-[protein]-cysteine S-methyltransferase
VSFWYHSLPTAIGPLMLGASESGLCWVGLHNQLAGSDYPLIHHEKWIPSAERLAPFAAEIAQYFIGARKTFSIPLDLRSRSEFHKRCWAALLEVPFGETCTYAELARRIGSAAAFRAVGQANHWNPVPIVVPCHRVLASGGKLGGYGGGLAAKRWLLEHEGVQFGAAEQPLLFRSAAAL